MSLTATLLVLVSAVLHAGWNLLGKRQDPSTAFFAIASFFSVLYSLPLLVIFRRALAGVPPLVWLLLALTGVCQAVYYAGLAGAYRSGDMSVAYPLARALPVALVAGSSALLGLGKPLNGLGLLGILAVAAGCLLIPLRGFGELRPENYWNRCCLMAGVAALGTCGYSLIDSEALRLLRTLPALGLDTLETTLLFLALENTTTTAALGVGLLLAGRERQRLRALWQAGWGSAALTGLLIMGTYGLVLAAMAYASNVSYIVAFRQLSIPLGALLGVWVQKEPAGLPKLLGVGVVFGGLMLVGLA